MWSTGSSRSPARPVAAPASKANWPTRPNCPTTLTVGDAWVIDGDIWVWTETDTWFNAGPYVGPQGRRAIQGEPGATGATGARASRASRACRVSRAPPAAPGPPGPQGIQGNPGTSVRIVGEVATVGALPAAARSRSATATSSPPTATCTRRPAPSGWTSARSSAPKARPGHRQHRGHRAARDPRRPRDPGRPPATTGHRPGPPARRATPVSPAGRC